MTITRTRAMIFGMKVSVISWICVTAWKTLTARPTRSPTRSMGPPTLSDRMIASVASEMTVSWFTVRP